MKKILLITGKKAEKTVNKQKEKLNNYFGEKKIFKVKKLPVNVASFITKRMVEKIDISSYDCVIVPGTSPSDYSNFKNTYKGSKNASDLFNYLKHGLDNLSPQKPIDDIINLSKNFEKELRELEEESRHQMKIRNLSIGKEKPMRVLAEVVGSNKRSKNELKKIIRDYERQGADLIDLGLGISAQRSEVKETIDLAKEITNLPISIDTTEPDLLKQGLKQGVDLILSLTWENFEAVKKDIDNQPCVIAANENLEELVKKVKEETNAKPIADPILDPPNLGLTKSLNRYYHFHQKNKDIPLLFGIGNVSEMIDADSIGVNAIMASIASELGSSILLTPQASKKTKNSVKELKKASKLSYVSKNKNISPKDQGIDLLCLKDKEEEYTEPVFGEEIIKAREDKEYVSDKGFFEITLDRKNQKIIATFYKNNQDPVLSIKGNKAKEISDTIKRKNLINELGHALYLGRELEKAEIALKTGKNYLQERPLFNL